jgi:hypothetical protein
MLTGANVTVYRATCAASFLTVCDRGMSFDNTAHKLTLSSNIKRFNAPDNANILPIFLLTCLMIALIKIFSVFSWYQQHST